MQDTYRNIKTTRIFSNLCKGDDSAWISGRSNGYSKHRVGAQYSTETWVHQANIELFVSCAWKRFVDNSNGCRYQSLSGEECYSNSSKMFKQQLVTCYYTKKFTVLKIFDSILLGIFLAFFTVYGYKISCI